MKKPNVDFIEGLSPAISIEQKNTSKNPRSTVATVTEIYDYMRVLLLELSTFLRLRKPIVSQSVSEMVDKIKLFQRVALSIYLRQLFEEEKVNIKKKS